VADAVVTATGSQIELVRSLPREHFRLAHPNEGHLLAAILLREGILSSILTLNFDLALNVALTMVGSRGDVTTISGPEEHANLTATNVIYLHRNAHSPPERWILRTAAIDQEWRDGWEQVIAQRILATPFVVFAGLGTPAAVLIQTAITIRRAIPAGMTIYQVDQGDRASSRFFAELGLTDEAYLQMEWGPFMRQLSARILEEQRAQLERACRELITANGWGVEDVETLCARLSEHGLIAVGRMRASWLLSDSPYLPTKELNWPWLADLLVAVALVARMTGSQPTFGDDGLLELRRDGQIFGLIILAHGRGFQRWLVVEGQIQRLRWSATRVPRPRFAIVAGIPDGRPASVAPPGNILYEETETSIIMAAVSPRMFSVDELRREPALAQRFVS
jgi:hypothetical protein